MKIQKVVLALCLFMTIVAFSSCQESGTLSESNPDIVTLEDGTELVRYSKTDDYAVRSLKNCTSAVYVVPDISVNGQRITEMWETAAVGNDSIKTMIIQDNIESFSFDLYYEFGSLESIFIGAGVRKIWAGTFAQCPNLKQVTIDVRNADYYSDNNAVIEKSTGRMIAASGATSKIPDSVVVIGSNAFDNNCCPDMLIPEGINGIESYAFQGCEKLRAVFIPSTVAAIGSAAFKSTTARQMRVTVFCESIEKPEGWDENWCGDGVKDVVWGAAVDDYLSFLNINERS